MGEIKLEKLVTSKDRVDYWFSTTEDLKCFFRTPMHMFVQYDRCIENIPEAFWSFHSWEMLCKLRGL